MALPTHFFEIVSRCYSFLSREHCVTAFSTPSQIFGIILYTALEVWVSAVFRLLSWLDVISNFPWDGEIFSALQSEPKCKRKISVNSYLKELIRIGILFQKLFRHNVKKNLVIRAIIQHKFSFQWIRSVSQSTSDIYYHLNFRMSKLSLILEM